MAACKSSYANPQLVIIDVLMNGVIAVLLIMSTCAEIAISAKVITDGTIPARGWSSWNAFRCDINENLIKEVARAMVYTGLRDAGYVYVNIDDCWMEKRDAHGVLQPFASKFPSGMKALADYVHSLGLKLGLYSDAGNKTCEGYPGSWGHEVQDARTFAEWGIDYLKYDYCGMPQDRESVEAAYHTMSVALAKSGRHILFSMCSWGAGQPWEWAQGVANSWRVSPDLFAVWDREQANALHLPNFLISVMEVAEVMADKHAAARPGSFNDGDMLVVGLDGMDPYGTPQGGCPAHLPHCTPGQYISREVWGSVGGLSLTQQRSHFSLWVMLSSPLILGNDPRLLRRNVRDMLTATEVLEIHGDPLGKQAERVFASGHLQLWRKPLKGSGKLALLVLNTGNSSIDSTDVYFAQHLRDMHSTWARALPVNFTVGASELPCEDEHELCVEWAAEGECKHNPGFMLWKCRKSCPSACSEQAKQLSGPQAAALVRDVWEQEDLGLAVGHLQIKHLEPYESRLFGLQFVDPMGLGGSSGGVLALVGGGVSGTAGYSKPTSSARSGDTVVGFHATGKQAIAVAAAAQMLAGSEGSTAEAVPTAAAGAAGSTVAVRRLEQKRKDCEWHVTQVTAQLQQLKGALAQVQQQLAQANQAAAAAAAAEQPPAEQRDHAAVTAAGARAINSSSSSSARPVINKIPNFRAGMTKLEAPESAVGAEVPWDSRSSGSSNGSGSNGSGSAGSGSRDGGSSNTLKSRHEGIDSVTFVAAASLQQQAASNSMVSGLVGLIAVNVCVLCFGFALGMLYKHRRFRHHASYFRQQQYNPLKLY